MDEYSVGEYIIYCNGEKYELGRIKSLREDGAFVAYHEGETGALTPYGHMHKLINHYCIKDTTLGGDFFKTDIPHTEKVHHIPFDPMVEMAIKRKVEERLKQTETQKETQNSDNDTPQTDSEITRNSLRTDCTGCKFVGWYDTEFPCVNCIRKNKDYYTPE